MNTTKQGLVDKCNKIKASYDGLRNLIHGIEELPDIHFEIGQKNLNGTTRYVFNSRSIQAIMAEYERSGYAEEDGWFIDAWEGEESIADISPPAPKPHITKGEFKVEMAKDKFTFKSKVMFEINKKVVTGTVGDSGNPCVHYQLETVFRSSDPMDCQKEWARKQYSDDGYVMDIRVAPNGEESYHFADIDTDSMSMETSKEPPPVYNKAWLIDVIRYHMNHNQTPQATADKILEAYKGNQS